MNNPSTLHTKWGTARVNNHGYYHITSKKEGNCNKILHRLIWEDFWGVKLPTEIHIHHKDRNKLNNCILNLEAMHSTEHLKLHNTGENNSMFNKKHSEDILEKISINRSESTNTTGYYRVYKHKHNRCIQGFLYRYAYFTEDKTRKYISSVDIDTLKEKVLAKGLPWLELSDEGCVSE